MHVTYHHFVIHVYGTVETSSHSQLKSLVVSTSRPLHVETRQPAPNATFLRGCVPGGTVTPKFELGGDFCTMHLPRVSPSNVYSFGSYRVDKQTDAAENIQRSSLGLRYNVG